SGARLAPPRPGGAPARSWIQDCHTPAVWEFQCQTAARAAVFVTALSISRRHDDRVGGGEGFQAAGAGLRGTWARRRRQRSIVVSKTSRRPGASVVASH